MNSDMVAGPVVPGMTALTRGNVTKRMESESEVKVGFEANGSFMMMIVIDSRWSRRVIILAISSVATRWPIPENGKKISYVFSVIPNQWLLVINLMKIDKKVNINVGFTGA